MVLEIYATQTTSNQFYSSLRILHAKYIHIYIYIHMRMYICFILYCIHIVVFL